METGLLYAAGFLMSEGDEMSKNWRPATKLVHGGTLRSQYGETSEAIFLTQGFVYDSSEAAEARFKGETEGFIYARYGSPTNDMASRHWSQRRSRNSPRPARARR